MRLRCHVRLKTGGRCSGASGLEDFLVSAFASVDPVSKAIGRVVVEPDYEVAPDDGDAGELAAQLTEVLRGQPAASDDLASRGGLELKIDEQHPVLRKYLRRITLHADTVEGSWVEVAPPGNWI